MTRVHTVRKVCSLNIFLLISSQRWCSLVSESNPNTQFSTDSGRTFSKRNVLVVIFMVEEILLQIIALCTDNLGSQQNV